MELLLAMTVVVLLTAFVLVMFVSIRHHYG